jgi:hypothetical protein
MIPETISKIHFSNLYIPRRYGIEFNDVHEKVKFRFELREVVHETIAFMIEAHGSILL